MKYKIEAMAENNLEECAMVIRQSFSTVAKEFGLTIDNCPTNGAFIKKERLVAEREKGHQQFGLLINDQIVGYMQLEKRSDELYLLEKLAVLPEKRHLGLGKSLLNYAKELVAVWGGRRISIGIIEENTVLKNWYLSYGFQHTGTHKFENLPFTVGFMEMELE